MNDEILINNYFLILKSTIEVYIHGTIESSNKSVREVLESSLDETLKCQERTYNLMVDNDWYTYDNVNVDEIVKSINSLNQN